MFFALCALKLPSVAQGWLGRYPASSLAWLSIRAQCLWAALVYTCIRMAAKSQQSDKRFDYDHAGSHAVKRQHLGGIVSRCELLPT